jgi:glucose/arabinose dehydrogenase
MKKLLRWIAIVTVAAIALLVAAIWFGPVQIGDKKVLLDFLLGRGIAPPTAAQAAAKLKVADGFRLEVYSTDVPLARWPLATSAGDVIIARTRGDEVVLLERDTNGDGKPDAVRTLLPKVEHPHGLALHDGWLYVGELTGIGRIRFDAATG